MLTRDSMGKAEGVVGTIQSVVISVDSIFTARNIQKQYSRRQVSENEFPVD